jgi:transposase
LEQCLRTPKHASWLKQIELWFSILARKVLRRGSFTSAQDLKDKINRFIAYFTGVSSPPVSTQQVAFKNHF